MSKHYDVKNMIKPIFDLAGQKFGEIIVLYRTRSTGKRGSYWMCRCSCGAEFEKRGGAIREMTTDRCMVCWFEKKKEETREKNARLKEEKSQEVKEKRLEFDLSGMEFGSLSVLRPVKESATKGHYICKCSCGENLEKRYKDLITGKKTKCSACARLEKAEAKIEKIYRVIKEGSFACRNCKEDFDLSNASASRLKRGEFTCNNCHNARIEKWRNQNYERNSKASKIGCVKCGEIKDIDDYFNVELYQKIPRCRDCHFLKVKNKFQQYREVNLGKEKIQCANCFNSFLAESYIDSQLNLKEPVCRKCFFQRRDEYWKRKCKDDPIFKEKRQIGQRIYGSLRKGGFKKNGTAAEYLGCSKDEFIAYIEAQFRDGMSWDNRSEWHLDHLIPLSTAKTSEEIKLLWHHTNLRPLWSHENLSKGKRINWSLEEYLNKKDN